MKSGKKIEADPFREVADVAERRVECGQIVEKSL